MTLRRRMKPGCRLQLPKMPISRLHKDVLLQIFKKMKAEELVRMRKTCSFINAVAEKHKKNFASRPALGVPLQIFGQGRNELFFSCKRHLAVAECIQKDFDNKISGISFSTISVDNKDRRRILRIVKIFEKLQPVCETFRMTYCPLDLIVPLTNCVSFKNELIISQTSTNMKNWDLEKALSFLSSMKMARNCSKFAIYLPDESQFVEGILEKVNGFSLVSLCTTKEGFLELLWDIFNSKDKITINQILIDSYDSDLVFACESLPPFQNIPKPLGSLQWPQRITFIDKCPLALEEFLLSTFANPHICKEYHDDTDDQLEDDDIFEYYEDEKNEHKEDEKVEPRLQYKILKRNVRSIVSSIVQ